MVKDFWHRSFLSLKSSYGTQWQLAQQRTSLQTACMTQAIQQLLRFARVACSRQPGHPPACRARACPAPPCLPHLLDLLVDLSRDALALLQRLDERHVLRDVALRVGQLEQQLILELLQLDRELGVLQAGRWQARPVTPR